MKIRLNHLSLFDIKWTDRKLDLQEFGQAVNYNINKLKEVVFTDSAYKTTMFYLLSALSIIFLLAFVQLSDFDKIVKIVLGVSILSVNVWLLKQYNL